MQRSTVLLVFALLTASVTAGGAACNFFNDYGNLWAGYSTSSAGGDVCAGMGGTGGFGGAGGAGGAGGDSGVGGAGSGVGGAGSGVGVGGSGVASVTVGVGGGGEAWSEGDEGHGHMARAPRRHRGRRSGIGRAGQADCSGQPQQNYIPPPPSRMPNWQSLTTTKLRWIAAQNGIGAGQTGITQSRTIGVAFETWVLKTMGQLPRWSTLIFSPARQKANTSNGKLGLPASVIPEFVGDQTGTTVSIPSMSVKTVYFDQSLFFEVKAVTGPLTLGTSQYQILGLLDIARIAGTNAPTQMHPPPAVFFTTTGNTTVSPDVVAKGTDWGVAVWQQQVLYDANSANPNNPNLSLGDEVCLNPGLYAGWAASWIAPGPFPSTPLTWPTDQEQASVVVGGDPDPAEVD